MKEKACGVFDVDDENVAVVCLLLYDVPVSHILLYFTTCCVVQYYIC